MKICFVNILYSKLDHRGGLGAHIQDLSRELAKRGHEVTVLTAGTPGSHEDRGVRIVSLGKVGRYSGPAHLLNPLNLFRRLRYMVRVANFVRKSQFDVVEAAEAGLEQFFLVLLKPCPIVTKLHGSFRYIYGGEGAFTRLIERLEAFVVNRSDGIYTSSAAYSKAISEDYGINGSRIRIIPYGIDLATLDALAKPAHEPLPAAMANKRLVFLSVGSSARRKGAPVFIAAASQLIQSDFLFVLSCSDSLFLRDVTLSENILLLPNLERAEFYQWLSRAEIVVLPSQFESFSIVAREAMLLGKWLILSANIPLEGIEKDYHRIVVLPEIEPNALATALLSLTNNQNGLPTALISQLRDRYSLAAIAASTEVYYEEISRQFVSSRT